MKHNTNNSSSISNEYRINTEHKLKEHVNHNDEYTGLFYCVKCNKAEIELFEPCEKQEDEK